MRGPWREALRMVGNARGREAAPRRLVSDRICGPRPPAPPPPPRGLRDSSRPLKFPPLSPLPFKSSSFSDRSPGAGGAAEAGRGGRASGPPSSCPRRCRPCPRVRQRAQTALSRLAGGGD